MYTRIIRWWLSGIVLLGLPAIFFIYSLAYPGLNQKGDRIGIPVRIKIVSIGVDAVIEQVAITDDGLMDVPKFPVNTGWYSLGPRPGESGSAVIDGHVDDERGDKAVFSDLHNLRPGDKIEVQDDRGLLVSFIVRESRRYDPDADSSEIFISNDERSHLNLITCEGTWDEASKSYSQRLVVFTDREM
ncbi:MAG: hypothetical protein UW46_C0006G0040 [Candidatus Yanofskybacteria bacterium GW2011_GWF1_44_227]|uniref:Peptidase C60 sortase A and B n=1 Tax=Candidatus Yanofskybacteria bacterium GW2011_GWE2_40_11 TaxID=1619033 RepID=A0A0G0TRJ2_9BACT|nr:MAG: hypothetical protein UT69_C0002G0035 [Candidatus Yanofskybacteria bacterium GW2011_GWE1_40_10]KKR40487.1 MAG: hypothetical protein UT75_C0008G0009 [Candidatus Yanofskybacteria bacterium GW2011_GWE2_40_11]KKT15445.1 MAG: hypothetical protein UV97_C0006G0012 [Candidatus Yanofskybacteria bacterium GW2011_GWF2_43_596]KKT53139.1 MAG: hypothetical protein UW46_C0006G0040 [Candidatus Yanofskybacteria bacterium GW2011_GWF1_44_227]OGN35512.1 MAG: hypothetical protein A2207_02110 [Candidatus Yano